MENNFVKYSKSKKGKTLEEIYGKEKSNNIRKNISKAMKGKISWSKGLTKETDERLKKMAENVSKSNKNNINLSKALKGNKNVSEARIIQWKDPEYRDKNSKAISEGMKGMKFSENHCKNLSKALIKKWEDPEYRETQLKAMLQGLFKRPTSYEKKISELCIENSLPFIYTGDGKFLINYKNPDFVNHQDKVVIEVFYSWYKIRDYGSVENYKEFCRKKYDPAGWRVIFIDENEVNVENWKELCLNKIRENI